MPAAAEATASSKWSIIKEALAGTHQDFTEGSLSRGIALLAIPTILELGMESTFGLVDAFWVAKLGANAIAVVGLTESLIVLVFSVAMGLSMAATATVARRIGEKDPEGAALSAVQAILCGLLVAAATGLGGALFAPQLLGLMHATPEVIAEGSFYTRVMLGGNASIMLLFLINGIFRGSGDATAAMRTLWLSNAINFVLDPCLIYGWAFFPRLGVNGAAVATTTGRTIGVLYQLWVLSNGRGRVTVMRRHLRVDWPTLVRLLRLSVTATIQYFIAMASWVTLARINATFGSAAVAGYTLSIRIIMFALMPSWGICSAAATLVGQNLGARRPDRSERAVWMAGGYNMAVLTVVGILFHTLAGWIVGRFTTDPAVAAVGTECLKLVSLGYPCYAWGMTMEQAFNGAGDTKTPTWMNLVCYWLLQLPLAWTLALHAGLGPRGVYVSICGAESVLAVVAIVLFRRGKWKKVVV
ncbi:MAG TPA: MATE family efflux transporter [Bryobacteraceae bacterium]|jgi:putative MATE family efflux protein